LKKLLLIPIRKLEGLNNSLEDSHPRLQPNFFKSQPMVYDTTIEAPRIEFEYMLRMLQQSIDDKDNQWAFMLRQLGMYFLLWRMIN
jgi:hypothetical protein